MHCTHCGAPITPEDLAGGACRFCSTAVERPRPQPGGRGTYVDDKVAKYAHDLAAAAGGSAQLHALLEAAKAEVRREKRGYIKPEDVKVAARAILQVDQAALQRALDDTEFNP